MNPRNRIWVIVLASLAAFVGTSALVRGSRSAHAAPPQAKRQAAAQAPQKKHFLVILNNERKTSTAKFTDEQFQQLIGQHFAQLKKLFAEGKVLAGGPRVDEVYGFLLLEVASEAEAKAIVSDDACVQAGLFRPEVHEIHLALMRGTPLPQ
jgi:uncharacterized protein YciI